jgi:hypothetical protein
MVRRVARAYMTGLVHEQMRREAAVKDWMNWMAQPFRKIVDLHKEFVYGPVEELVNHIFRKLAPDLVKAIAGKEVDERVQAFTRGATLGKFDFNSGRPERAPTADATVKAGYEWGYSNPDEMRGEDLPRNITKNIVEDALHEFREKLSTNVMRQALSKAWHALNPVNTVKAVIAAIKKHGWKLGVALALFEIFEHFLLPSIISYFTGDPKYLALATMPIGEVIYAVVLPLLGRAPKELQQADPDGHLDWYEQHFGPVKIAAAAR